MMRWLLQTSDAAVPEPSKFNKRQVEAIVIYLSVAVVIGVAVFLGICYGRRRKMLKVHDTSVVDRECSEEADSDSD